MGTESNNRTYYIISDLHIGGDEQLKEIDFLDELIDFLTELETTDEDAELIINGDAFGLWEFTELEGIEKFEMLEETYPSLFEQFKSTGKNIDITLLPGNHDHELAAYEEYVDRLDKYNINLVQERSVKRTLDGQVIHFEHGHQQYPNNKVEDWGNPHASPLGYYYNTLVTSRAGQLSDRGKFNWLKDVQAVTPTERVPVWLFSKYFYREMNPLLRYSLFPFLLLFNISVLLAVLSGLDIMGIWSMPIEEIEALFVSLGRPGTAVWTFLTVNIIIAGLILLVGIPLYFLRRDIRKTVNRFGVFETELTVDPERPYQDYAEELFTNEEQTTLFCYGHTHRPGVQSVDGGMIVNSGTWLKRLHRRDGIIGILPPVFYPSYQLSTVRISSAEQADAIAVDFIEVQKPSPATEELTWTERFFTVGREPDLHLPDRRVIDQEGDCKQIRTVRDSE